MSDLIDRTDALMYLNSIRYVVFMCGSQHDALLVIKKAIKCIQDLPSAEPENCEGCKHLGKWENEVEYGHPSPCTCCKRRADDYYER